MDGYLIRPTEIHQQESLFTCYEETKKYPVRYITILYPVSKVSNQKISAKFTDDPSNSNHVSIEVTIGNQVYPLSFQLKH